MASKIKVFAVVVNSDGASENVLVKAGSKSQALRYMREKIVPSAEAIDASELVDFVRKGEEVLDAGEPAKRSSKK